jgi:hypothetical protein
MANLGNHLGNHLGNQSGYADDQLRSASYHVYYEVNMVVDTANALQSGAGHDPTTKNALLESFGVHARALIDFLMFTRSDKDDVYAALYFAKGDWTTPTLPAALDPVRGDVNKHFAHVTFTRLQFDPTATIQQRKEWDVLPIAKALCESIDKEFYAKVDKALLDGHWSGGVPMPKDVTPSKRVATGMAAQLGTRISGAANVGAGLTVTKSDGTKR